MSHPTRVIVADDHVLVAHALVGMLQLEPDIAVVGVVHTLAAAKAHLRVANADVLLLDQRFPDGYGTHAVPGLLSRSPKLAVVLLTASDDLTLIGEALRVGCAGYIEKAAGMAQLANCVRSVAAGDRWLSRSVRDRLTVQKPRLSGIRVDELTRREMQVLVLLADGTSPAAIAAELQISGNTLRNHVQGVLSKLEAHSRIEAVATAVREGLLAPP